MSTSKNLPDDDRSRIFRRSRIMSSVQKAVLNFRSLQINEDELPPPDAIRRFLIVLDRHLRAVADRVSEPCSFPDTDQIVDTVTQITKIINELRRIGQSYADNLNSLSPPSIKDQLHRYNEYARKLVNRLWELNKELFVLIPANESELVIELDVPDDVCEDDIEREIVRVACQADALHRTLGGKGLTIRRLEVYQDSLVPEVHHG